MLSMRPVLAGAVFLGGVLLIVLLPQTYPDLNLSQFHIIGQQPYLNYNYTHYNGDVDHKNQDGGTPLASVRRSDNIDDTTTSSTRDSTRDSAKNSTTDSTTDSTKNSATAPSNTILTTESNTVADSNKQLPTMNPAYIRTMAHRRQVLTKVCQTHTTKFSDALAYHYFYSSRNHYLYCAVPKIGSSTMKRVLYVMEKGSNENPLSLSGMGIHQSGVVTQRTIKRQGIGSPLEIKDPSLVKIMFTRNPYHKMFSAFTDKLYSMVDLGLCSKIANERRSSGSTAAAAAARHLVLANISFSDCLEYAMGGNPGVALSRDKHFLPVSSDCDACHVGYDVIGKMETFNADMEYFLSALNKTSVWRAMGDVDANHEQRVVNDIISRTFRKTIAVGEKKKKDHVYCAMKDVVLRRTWSLLQIRGYLSDPSKYPLLHYQDGDGDMRMRNCDVDVSWFKAQAMKALSSEAQDPEAREARSAQRQAYLWRAYRGVPLSVLRRYRDFVQKDCDLFDYDCSPPEIFSGRRDGDEEGNIFTDVKYMFV